MRNIITIALREFNYNLRRPSFLFSVFGTPAIIAIALVLAFASDGAGEGQLADYAPVGYVDYSVEQVLAAGIMPQEYPDLFVPYESEGSAETAARAGELSAYFVLPETYMSNGQVQLYTMRSAPSELRDAISTLLRDNLSVDVEHRLAVDILATRPDLDVTVLEGNRRFDQNGAFLVAFMPVIYGFLLIMTTVTTSTFLMSGLVEEKTNRIIEVLITTVRPMELLVGKVVGLGALGLLQVLMLLAAGVIGISIAQQNNIISGLSIPLDMAIMAIVYYLLAYFLLAVIGIGIGAVVGTEQESRQLSGFFMMPIMIPYILFVTFLVDPNGTVPTVLSLIPFTSPMAVMMRMGMTTIPTWQIIVSIGGLIITNLLLLVLAARLFRWGVLSTDKTPNLRRIFQALRGKAPVASRPVTSSEVA